MVLMKRWYWSIQAKRDVRKLVLDAQRGRLEAQPGKSLQQSFEARVNQRLNQAREVCALGVVTVAVGIVAYLSSAMKIAHDQPHVLVTL